MKKVLFLGNSFTYYNDLPDMVEKLSGGALICHSITRGGAFLNAYKTESDELSLRLSALLSENKYDIAVLQEQSLNAIADIKDYLSSIKHIASCLGDTEIVIYGTWSYADGSDILCRAGLTYSGMTESLAEAADTAARLVGGMAAQVGYAFADTVKSHPEIELYDPDGLHPSYDGSLLAACVILHTLGVEINAEIPLWTKEILK